MNAKLLMDKAGVLQDYFCIHIDQQNLSKLPVILDQYTPDMDYVPEFILSLANDVSLHIGSWFDDCIIFMWIIVDERVIVIHYLGSEYLLQWVYRLTDRLQHMYWLLILRRDIQRHTTYI